MTYAQAGRLASITTPLGGDVLLVARMTAREGLSTLFRLDLDLVSERHDIALADLIGKAVTVKLVLPEGEHRFFHGHVARFGQIGGDRRLSHYRAEVVPWLWFFTQRSDCRIFQGKSVPDILKEVFGASSAATHKLSLKGSHPVRDYCVQYRESDFAFASRLMESEGIHYWFEHQDGRHTMVITDDSDAATECPGQATARFFGVRDGVQAQDGIETWQPERVLHPGKWTHADYNFEQPGMSLRCLTKTLDAVGDNDKLEVYDYPGGFLTSDAGEQLATLRMEELETPALTVRGTGSCRAFTPGYKFELAAHPRDDCNGDYLIVAVDHHLDQSGAFETGGRDEALYNNSFTCHPMDRPWRPRRVTPAPVVHGSQTALVVGPSGEEVHVDKHGRIKVQFHWDRQGKKDENSSCWIRVSQGWAGKNWGQVMLPRIGQEVIVDFLEGDPDRPIVTGRVYNGEQTPPYELPANKTQSGLKSRSSKGGGTADFNEIRLEDKKGSEELYIHAQKDQNTVVENNQSVSVGSNQAIDVGNDRSLTVGKNESESIGENRSITVGKDHSESIGEEMSLSVGKDRSMSIGKDLSESVGGAMTLSVSKDRSTSIGGSLSVTVGKDVTFSVDGKQNQSVTKEFALSAKKIALTADDEIVIKVGSAQITMKKSGDIDIKGNKINVKGSGDVVLKGSKVTAN